MGFTLRGLREFKDFFINGGSGLVRFRLEPLTCGRNLAVVKTIKDLSDILPNSTLITDPTKTAYDLPPVVVPSFKLEWGSSQTRDGLPKGK